MIPPEEEAIRASLWSLNVFRVPTLHIQVCLSDINVGEHFSLRIINPSQCIENQFAPAGTFIRSTEAAIFVFVNPLVKRWCRFNMIIGALSVCPVMLRRVKLWVHKEQ